MDKLYKFENGCIYYWEAWETDGKRAIIHWGEVGHRGEHSEIRPGLLVGLAQKIAKHVKSMESSGYRRFSDRELKMLVIVFSVEGWGTAKDLDKRYQIERRLDQLLGWHGLGHVDGGSIGSGTMEIDCLVIDFDIAERVIRGYLLEEGFTDFKEIKRLT
ncbi:MAG: hypothetical protein H6592_08810 [Flavobacteriales bacterium]|nr:hypothetical protein [Flavobacteriales bacterium]